MNFGKEIIVRNVAGRDWRVSRHTVGTVLAFGAWVKEQVGDIWEVPDRYLDRLTDDKEKKQLISETAELRLQLRGFSLSCALAQRFLATEPGMAKLWQLQLAEHQPDVTLEQAWQVCLAWMEQSQAREAARRRLVVEHLRTHAGDAPEALADALLALADAPLEGAALGRFLAETGGVLPNS